MLPFPVGSNELTDKRFDLHPDHKRRHAAVFGKSGTGKTTLLHNMIVWDIHQGLGVSVLDPHGDLIDALLDNIPRRRTNDVILFRPHHPERVLGLNALDAPNDRQKPRVVSAILGIFKSIWGDAFLARSEYLMRGAATSLLSQSEPASFLSLLRFFTDDDYRRRIGERVADPVAQAFLDTYEGWTARYRDEVSSPVINKLDAFVSNPLLRAVIGQTKSSFDFRWMMDTGKILLCDLSKGALGEDVSALLGSLIVHKIELAALSREDVSEDDRRLHVLYADEAQNFVHGVDLDTTFAEARKYRLALAIATQTLSQLPPQILSAVLGNVGTLMSFRVSAQDAERLMEEFGETFSPRVMQHLPDYTLYCQTLHTERGVSRPKTAARIRALPPLDNLPNVTDAKKVVRRSLRVYGRPRDEVETAMGAMLAA